MDKWERELEQELCSTRINLPMLLKHYVRLKRMRHYMKRSFEFEWINEARAEFEEKQERYTQLIKEARRNYYVAKRRVEGEHASNCSCRGCRCIEGIERSGQRRLKDALVAREVTKRVDLLDKGLAKLRDLKSEVNKIPSAR